MQHMVVLHISGVDCHWRKMPHVSTPGPQELLYNGYITQRAEAQEQPPNIFLSLHRTTQQLYVARGSGLLAAAVCYAVPEAAALGLD
jgi:hypothetical protein